MSRKGHDRTRTRGTRGRVVEALRRGPATAGDLAQRLGLTHNAVRVHLLALQHDGLVRESGLQATASRPAALYEVVPRAEAGFSRAYAPFAAELVRELGARLPQAELEELMHAVGKRVAAHQPRPRGDLGRRVEAAISFIGASGGSAEAEETADGFLIRGHGCLLAEATRDRPEACRAMQSFLSELVEAPVEECCERGERPRCRFAVRRGD